MPVSNIYGETPASWEQVACREMTEAGEHLPQYMQMAGLKCMWLWWGENVTATLEDAPGLGEISHCWN